MLFPYPPFIISTYLSLFLSSSLSPSSVCRIVSLNTISLCLLSASFSPSPSPLPPPSSNLKPLHSPSVSSQTHNTIFPLLYLHFIIFSIFSLSLFSSFIITSVFLLSLKSLFTSTLSHPFIIHSPLKTTPPPSSSTFLPPFHTPPSISTPL